MANWLKPGLIILRDSLKGLETNILKRAVEGDKNALTTIAKTHGQMVPAGDKDQQALVNKVINPELSRREMFRRMGGAAAHAALELPSPLRFLQSTLDQVKPSLQLNLTPLEMLRYSQKYMDRGTDLPGDNPMRWAEDEPKMLGIHPSIQAWPATKISLRELLTRLDFIPDKEAKQHLTPLFKAMELEPTDENLDSLKSVAHATELYHPESIDANWDDVKHQAQDFAADEYLTTDRDLEMTAEEFGVKPEDLEKELNSYLSKVHNSPIENESDTYTNARRNLDSHVEDEAWNRGYMDEVSSNDSLADYFHPELGPGKSAKDFLEWWDSITPGSEIQHVIPDDHKLYELTSYDLGHDITEEEVNQLRKEFETRLKAYNETGKSQTDGPAIKQAAEDEKNNAWDEVISALRDKGIPDDDHDLGTAVIELGDDHPAVQRYSKAFDERWKHGP